MKNSRTVVYIMTLPTGHFYIGSTKHLSNRITRHVKELNKGTHHNPIFQEIWDKNEYSDINDLTLTITPCLDRVEAYEKERILIEDNLNNPLLLNICIGGRFGDVLSRHPNRDKIINNIRIGGNKVISKLSAEERRQRFGRHGKNNPMWGRAHTEETRSRISNLLKGRPSKLRGVKMSEERYRTHMAAMCKRNVKGDRNPFFGKKHSKETIEKLRDSFITRISNPEFLHHNSKKVSINGVIYKNAVTAAKELGIKYSTVAWRCRESSKMFESWFYINAQSTSKA